EVECTGVVHELVHGTAINNELNNMREYQIIQNRMEHFKECESDDQRWECLMKCYGWRTREIARDQLERRGIDSERLFRPQTRPKNNQTFLADHIIALWTGKVRSAELMNTFTGDDRFSPVLMRDLIRTLIDSSRRLGLADHIAKKIKNEVSVTNPAQIKVDLVADMMASTVNSFVNDFGYSLLSDGQKEKARRIAEGNSLPVYRYIGKERESSYSHADLTDLFERVFEQGGGLTESFDNQYNSWLEYMTIAFVVHLRQSDLPAAANRALGDIIAKICF
ncbi:MAG: virulence factor SrfC family protein, partial [Muribaculaceae bacterium]|nr:virulence factor SrfC family protein [Muribaculaceae bacterium]